jgi:hypothetical protein
MQLTFLLKNHCGVLKLGPPNSLTEVLVVWVVSFFLKHYINIRFGNNTHFCCFKFFGLLPGVKFWCMTNVSGSLVCPIFRVLGKKVKKDARR